MRHSHTPNSIYYKVVYNIDGQRFSAILAWEDVDVYASNLVLKYPKGKIVTAPKGTLGVFCFIDKESAYHFINNSDCGKLEVIKVKGISRPHYPKYTVSVYYLSAFYRNTPQLIKQSKQHLAELSWHYTDSYIEPLIGSTRVVRDYVPMGTISFNTIKVLT